MGNVLDLKNRLVSFRKSIDDELRKVMFDNEIELIELNEEQLYKGLNTEDRIIGVYSPFTDIYNENNTGKGHPKIAGQPYNFYDKGDLFQSITLSYKKGKIIFFSTDFKLNDIFNTIEEYGLISNPKETLFGLTIKNSEIASYDIMLPDFIKRFKDATGL